MENVFAKVTQAKTLKTHLEHIDKMFKMCLNHHFPISFKYYHSCRNFFIAFLRTEVTMSRIIQNKR
jgi:hypothetical protein